MGRPELLWTASSRFQKIKMGSCTELGWLPITDEHTCDVAARELHLTDFEASPTDKIGRPEGCYYFENDFDSTATLWLATNKKNKGVGAMLVNGSGFREPICMAQSTTLFTTTAAKVTPIPMERFH